MEALSFSWDNCTKGCNNKIRVAIEPISSDHSCCKNNVLTLFGLGHAISKYNRYSTILSEKYSK